MITVLSKLSEPSVRGFQFDTPYNHLPVVHRALASLPGPLGAHCRVSLKSILMSIVSGDDNASLVLNNRARYLTVVVLCR